MFVDGRVPLQSVRVSGVRRRRPPARKKQGESDAGDNGRWGGAAGNSLATRWPEPNCEGPRIPRALSGPKTPTRPRAPAQAGSGTSLEKKRRCMTRGGRCRIGQRPTAAAGQRRYERKTARAAIRPAAAGKVVSETLLSGGPPGSQHRSGIVRQAGNYGQRGVAGKC